ncbi:toll/interleukin-1 receptor domain-containing protein [Aquella oligotrophica]|uniref:SEFIR domain-containing protein n=1 Tax=Aquella oligotrophica TaxID=2067065 RepID=A0A2I7N5N9_9NEIS|nr:toll/interleukin-1 receptor domain-containing protein [Aquella oligotrophica]AUR51535.1 hypothetical protein CUN60_04270 [Aquella oligotrophica]
MSQEQKHVFISYCWTSSEYQSFVRGVADRLMSDGVNVTVDIYDLKEGDDKFSFMEKMVNDPGITNVLIMCNQNYKIRANNREAGVGTETQIISKEVYEQVQQSKFIPIICEKDENGSAYTPSYLSSRIYIDFSSEQSLNENWEQLVRCIYGQPQYQKPGLGEKPSYLSEEFNLPSSSISAKFSILKQAIINNKNNKLLYRNDFINACDEYVDSLRRRSAPTVNIGQLIIDDFSKLKVVRNCLIDWIALELKLNPATELIDPLINVLETFAGFRCRPEGLSQWGENWFDAHRLFLVDFVYYLIAILIKYDRFDLIHKLLLEKYYIYNDYTYQKEYRDFSTFYYGGNESINQALGKQYYSPAAELIRKNADNPELPFDKLVEADLLILLVVLVNDNITRWYPQLQYYNRHHQLELFARAEKKSWFNKIATATGISNPDELRVKVQQGVIRLDMKSWHRFDYSFWECLNLDKLGTL